MHSLAPYISILRPVNAVMSIIGVALGFWISESSKPIGDLFFLCIASLCALGYGNVINDLKDFEGDKINHPGRPLSKGSMSKNSAIAYAFILMGLSLSAGLFVSTIHVIAVLVPLILLTLYTFFLKNTPFLGNILVSLLVSYTLIFGGIGSGGMPVLIVPAILAFLLNLCREIIKDIQDVKGDTLTGVETTATLPETVVISVLIVCALTYVLLLGVPFCLGHFGLVYLVICYCALLPLHGYWVWLVVSKKMALKAKVISSVIKIEMVGGLAALAVDYLFCMPR
jgi:geranylgeranylglycerol-phosphate geranylgeranyltransferase